MGELPLSQEIIEHVLQFADGETLLTCRDVSPEFAAAVSYLGKSKNIWEKCYAKEKGQKYPYGVISKFHPHDEGISHSKNWEVIYETSFFSSQIQSKHEINISQVQIGKGHSDIQDVQTHGDLVLLLVKYNKDFANFYKILTVNLENVIVDKSCRFNANMLYITPVEDLSSVRRDAIPLNCDLCQLVAMPVDESVEGFPKFKGQVSFLTVEHSNGDVLWFNNYQDLLTKGNCFHTGNGSKLEDIMKKDSKSIKVFHRFTSLFVSCGETHKEFNTFGYLRANITASMCYSNFMFLGTDTGMLYIYLLKDENDLKNFDLNHNLLQFYVCFNSILSINVMELRNQFVVVCCSAKCLYKIPINRNLRSFA